MSAMGLEKEKAVKAINLIQSAGSLPLSDIRTGKKKVIVVAGQAVQVKCSTPVGLLKSITPVLFQLDETQSWSESLTVNDKLLMRQKGVCLKFPVTVINTSNHES